MEYTIISYGGGQTLEMIFNAVAALINSKTGSIYQPLVRIGILIGLFWSSAKLIYGDHTKFFTNWLGPFYLALNLFFAPTCTVFIKDPTVQQPPYKVDNVPWGLGAFAGTISQVSDEITRKIESVFSLPDDLKYHKTGTMLASHLIGEAKHFQIIDQDFAETMQDFVYNCVIYDGLLGNKYTLNDLLQSNDIWALIKKNPSPARAFTYRPPGVGQRGQICTCKDGIAKLDPLLTQEVESAFSYFGRKIFGASSEREPKGSLNSGHLLKSYLPVSFSYMAKVSQEAAANMMRQYMMVHTVRNSIESKSTMLGNAPSFAVRRAYLQQRANQETIAGFAGQKLLAAKNVMEALIYAAFILILPMALLPLGWSFISRWAGLLLWVHLWAPLYAVLNFIACVAARSKGSGLAILDQGSGITLANSVGFSNLHADMAAQAGYLSIFVGGLAYALVKGGAASFVHLAGQLGGPATSAASTAAGDMLSGNYSYGNLSQGSVQAYNTSFGQQQLSPSYSSGSFAQNDGMVSRITSGDGTHMVNIASSTLRSGINMSDSMSNSYSAQATEAAQVGENKTIAAVQSQAEALRNVLDLSSHQAKQVSSGQGFSDSQNVSQNESFTKLDNMVDRFAKENNVSKEHAASIIASASASFNPLGVLGNALGFKFEVGGTVQQSWSETDRELFSKAQDFTKQSSFQDALQSAKTAAKEARYNELDDTGKRYMQGFNASEEKSSQLRQEASHNLAKSESFNKAASWVEQHAGSINANLNQEYVEWLSSQNLPNSKGAMGMREAEAILAHRPDLDRSYQQQFLQTKMQDKEAFMRDLGVPTSIESMERAYQDHQPLKAEQLYAMQHVQGQADSAGVGSDFKLEGNVKAQVIGALNNVNDQIHELKGEIAEQGAARESVVKGVVKK